MGQQYRPRIKRKRRLRKKRRLKERLRGAGSQPSGK